MKATHQTYRHLLVLCIFLFVYDIKYVLAQNPEIIRPLNKVHFNLLGNASLVSLEYERSIPVNRNLFIAGGLGIGYNLEFQICLSGHCGPPDNYLTIPHYITSNYGDGRHLLEVGLGGTYISGNPSRKYLFYPMVGYRLQFKNPRKAYFRVFAQVPFGGWEDEIIFSPVGVSFSKLILD
ncbi:MAG: hypothetical protein KDC58_02225 [Cyclobacteriaceae bacterium]|nr:hypothetical protein [Cyclobacteriaceae bacterium]